MTAFDELFEGVEPAEDGGFVVQVGVVFALDDEALVGLDEVEEEVEVDELFGVRFHIELEAVEMDLIEAVFVDIEDHGNERHAAGIARDVDLAEQAAEGVVLIVVGFEHLFLDLGGERAERAVRGGCEAEREEVQAMADEFVFADAGLACGGHADDDIVLAGDAVEQGGERGKQGGEQGAAEFRRGFLQPLVAGGIEGDVFHRAVVGFHWRARTVGGEIQHGSAVGETGDPVVFRIDGFLAVPVGFFEAGVIREGHGGRQHGKVSGLAGIVGVGEFREDHAEGPAVADHVVRGEEEFVAIA